VAKGTTCCGDNGDDPPIKWYGGDCNAKCNNHFFGRGYLQTTWRLNYVGARDYGHCNEDKDGKEVDIVDEPEKVAEDEVLAWCTSAYFWKKNVHDDRCKSTCDLGMTISAINGDQECDQPSTTRRRRRRAPDTEHREAAQNRWCYFAAFYYSYTESLGTQKWPDDDETCITDLDAKREDKQATCKEW